MIVDIADFRNQCFDYQTYVSVEKMCFCGEEKRSKNCLGNIFFVRNGRVCVNVAERWCKFGCCWGLIATVSVFASKSDKLSWLFLMNIF